MSKHPINKLSMDGMHTSQKKGISLLHIFRKVFLIINHQGMQMKTALRFLLSPVRVAMMEKPKENRCLYLDHGNAD